MRIRPLVFLFSILAMLSLACSVEALERQVEEGAANLVNTASVRGEEIASTEAAEFMETARARLATGAPELRLTIQAEIQTEAPQFQQTLGAQLSTTGPQAGSTAEAAIATQLAGLASSIDLSPERQDILNRARAWVDAGVPYDSQGSRDGYRSDSAGFIAYAWDLRAADGAAISPDPQTLADYANQKSPADLQPGDALSNLRPAEQGHVVLFVRWLNIDRTRFLAYEQNGGAGKTIEKELTLTKLPSGEYTIQEYDAFTPGPYVALEKR